MYISCMGTSAKSGRNHQYTIIFGRIQGTGRGRLRGESLPMRLGRVGIAAEGVGRSVGPLAPTAGPLHWPSAPNRLWVETGRDARRGSSGDSEAAPLGRGDP